MTFRFIAFAAAACLSACASSGGIDEPLPSSLAEPTASVASDAVVMKATLYDDGLACPGGCDAHVVFHPTHNGTQNAYAPSSSRAAPSPCEKDRSCFICFGPDPASCMTALYRGGGPARGRFDMTPAMFESRCGEAGLPAAFAAECTRLKGAAARLGYDRRVNCLATPTEPRCALLLGPQKDMQRRDAAEREACLSLGERAYNARQADPSLHRTLGCNYFLNQKGGNSAGESWFRLAPGSCRPGTYVGRDGLDCCSASVLAAAALHPECRSFFVDRL